jgi:hypothetical protein
MDRRDFLSRTGALFGAAFAGLPLSSTATAGGVSYDWTSEADMEAFGVDLDRKAAAIRALPAPILDRTVRAEGLPSGWVQDMFASLTVVGTFRDLPREGQDHAAMQARMRDEGQRLGQHVLRAARYVRGLGRERRRALRDHLRADPELASWLSSELDRRTPSSIESERTEQLGSVLSSITWRMKNQDPVLLIDETVGHVERIAADAGLEPHEWDDAIAGIDDDGVADGDAPQPLPDEYAGSNVRRSHRTAHVGLIVMGIAGGLGALGLVMIAAGGAVAGLVTITAGLLTLLVAFFILIVAAVQAGTEDRVEPTFADPQATP